MDVYNPTNEGIACNLLEFTLWLERCRSTVTSKENVERHRRRSEAD